MPGQETFAWSCLNSRAAFLLAFQRVLPSPFFFFFLFFFFGGEGVINLVVFTPLRYRVTDASRTTESFVVVIVCVCVVVFLPVAYLSVFTYGFSLF